MKMPSQSVSGETVRNAPLCMPTHMTAGICPGEVRIIRNLEEIERLRPLWNSWSSSPGADFELYSLACRTTPGFIRPHVLVLYREGEPVSMLPGMLQTGRIQLRLGYWRLAAPGATILSFPQGALLGEDTLENCQLLMSEILQCLARAEAHVAILHHTKVESDLYQFAKHAPQWLSRDYVSGNDLHCSMVLSGTYQEIQQSLSRDHRWQIRRIAKRLLVDSGGELEVRKYASAADLQAMLPHAEEVAGKTYQRALGVGFSQDRAVMDYLAVCARKGWFRGYVLFFRQRPCAFVLGTVYRKTFHLDYLGYDPAFGRYSPGTHLLMNVFEDLCAGGVSNVDFGYGDERYKQQFGTQRWQESRVHVFGPGLKSIAINLARASTAIMDRFGRRALERTSLFSLLKKRWRKSLQRKQTDHSS